jgi:hypothetical protein
MPLRNSSLTPCSPGWAPMHGVPPPPPHEVSQVTQSGYSILWPKGLALTQAWPVRVFSMTDVQMLVERSPNSIEIAKLGECK